MQCIDAFMWSGVCISVFLLTTAQRSSGTRYSLESVCLSACLSVSVTSLCVLPSFLAILPHQRFQRLPGVPPVRRFPTDIGGALTAHLAVRPFSVSTAPPRYGYIKYSQY